MFQTGYASQPTSTHRGDGLTLTDLWITAVVRCAPPANKPLPEELRNCAPFLDEEITLLPRLRVVICLGKIAFDAYLAHLQRTGVIGTQPGAKSGYIFRHAAHYKLPNGLHLLSSYHPSLQNTNTGRLTPPMLHAVFQKARTLAD